MSSVLVNETRLVVRDLEQREMRRGYKQPDARKRIAHRLGALPGTLTSLAVGRLKKIDAALRERVRALVIRELEQEIGRLSHELEIHKRTGLRMDAGIVTEAEALVATYHKIMKETV